MSSLPTLRGSKTYRVSAERDDFANALEQLAACRDAYSPIITTRLRGHRTTRSRSNSNAGMARSKRST
jgi:hypothetical protein